MNDTWYWAIFFVLVACLGVLLGLVLRDAFFNVTPTDCKDVFYAMSHFAS